MSLAQGQKNMPKIWLFRCLLAVLGSQGIVVKCTAAIFFRMVDCGARRSMSRREPTFLILATGGNASDIVPKLSHFGRQHSFHLDEDQLC